jgi:hypothetical protein
MHKGRHRKRENKGKIEEQMGTGIKKYIGTSRIS